MYAEIAKKIYIFQSTLPVWGATLSINKLDAPNSISIHAPRVGSDTGRSGYGLPCPAFQSTLPVWGATAENWLVVKDTPISIHAPRVGSDDTVNTADKATVIISIHAPRVGSDCPSWIG